MPLIDDASFGQLGKIMLYIHTYICIHTHTYIYKHSDCVHTRRSKVIRQDSECAAGGSRFPKALGKRVQPRPFNCPPASFFSENQLSEPESPYSNAPKSFPISMGAPAQRASWRLLSSARPLLFPALLGLPVPRAFSLRGHNRAPNSRPREGRGRGAARRGTSVAFRAEVRSIQSL